MSGPDRPPPLSAQNQKLAYLPFPPCQKEIRNWLKKTLTLFRKQKQKKEQPHLTLTNQKYFSFLFQNITNVGFFSQLCNKSGFRGRKKVTNGCLLDHTKTILGNPALKN